MNEEEANAGEGGVGAGDERDTGDVGAWWLSGAAKELYQALKQRWAQLTAWDPGLAKVPENHVYLEAWQEFAAKWERGDEEPDALNAFEADLHGAELRAAEHGYAAGPRVSVPLEDLDWRAGAHDVTSAAIRGAEETFGGAAWDLLAKASAAWERLPTVVKVGAGVVVGGQALAFLLKPLVAVSALRRPVRP